MRNTLDGADIVRDGAMERKDQRELTTDGPSAGRSPVRTSKSDHSSWTVCLRLRIAALRAEPSGAPGPIVPLISAERREIRTRSSLARSRWAHPKRH